MSAYSRFEEDKKVISKTFDAIRLAFAEFLIIPTSIFIGFLLLAAGSYRFQRRRC